MKDLIRVVLIDPAEESRNALQRLLRGIDSLWLAEVLTSFQDAIARAGEIVAHVTIVVLDHDPEPGDRADSETRAIKPRHRRPAGEPLRRQRADPEGHPRRRPRVPAAARRTSRAARYDFTAAARPRRVASGPDPGPANHHRHRGLRRSRLHHAGRQPGLFARLDQGTRNHPARSRSHVRRR